MYDNTYRKDTENHTYGIRLFFFLLFLLDDDGGRGGKGGPREVVRKRWRHSGAAGREVMLNDLKEKKIIKIEKIKGSEPFGRQLGEG